MTKYIRVENLNQNEIECYTKLNQSCNLVATGEAIRKEWDGGAITKVVYKGNWTPYGYIRDCGDHYIEALYSSYRRISKDLQTIVDDVEDW